MTNDFFAELTRCLRKQGIDSEIQKDRRLEIFLHGQPALFVSPKNEVFLLPEMSGNDEAGDLYHEVAQISDEVFSYADEALYYKNKGIPGYKAHPGGPVEFDMEVHQAVRDAVGNNYILMSDPVGEYSMGDAVQVGRQLERLGYKWFEEPFRDFELYKYSELCRALDIPIAATETTRGCHWGVAQVIAQRAADIVRADVSWKDGITGTLKIAHLADSFGMNCELHTTTMNYMDLVNVHVSCAIRNCEYFEYFVPEDNYRLPMKGDLPIRDGRIYVPEAPGVGAELDWDLIQRNCHSYRCQEL